MKEIEMQTPDQRSAELVNASRNLVSECRKRMALDEECLERCKKAILKSEAMIRETDKRIHEPGQLWAWAVPGH